jgi:hypothetical protein
LGGAAVLPDDGAGTGDAGASVPRDDRLALVGDTDRSDRPAELRVQLGEHRARGVPDLRRVVLDPAGLGEVLGELAVGPAHRPAVAVDRERSDAGGAGVDRDDDGLVCSIARHGRTT